MQKSTNNLRKARKEAGYTLDRLAKETAVPRSTIGAFEKGSRPLNAEHKEKIEKVLGVDICGISTEQPRYLAAAESTAAEQWNAMPTDELEAMLCQCVEERKWGPAHLVCKKLMDRELVAINQQLTQGE